MYKQLLSVFIVLSCFGSNVSAMRADDPFAKSESVRIGTDISWLINKQTTVATKTVGDDKGSFYHLQFDNKQLKLFISSDASGVTARSFDQLEVKDVLIDGKQSPLFKWCLRNQESHSRFLQQGLSVKKNICSIDGRQGVFIMRLNKDTLVSLQKAEKLQVLLKPFRTPLWLNYDISDFTTMQAALNSVPVNPSAAASSEPNTAVRIAIATATVAAPAKAKKKCITKPPADYKKIKVIEYDCADTAAKKNAEAALAAQVNEEKAKQKRLAEEKKQKELTLKKLEQEKELALKLEQEKILAAETAAIAASEARLLEINDGITQKMLKVCEKYWRKGEHRCYCEKYIDYAPSRIQASSTCE